MSQGAEQRPPTPIEEQLKNAFYATTRDVTLRLHGLNSPDIDDRFDPFVRLSSNNGMTILFTTERYDADMEAAGRNATTRPFGIELGTLSPNVQLVLYPRMIYRPGQEEKEMAREMGEEARVEGPQAILYFLDGFVQEEGQIESMAANLFFIGHMAEALINERYPLEGGERSNQFLDETRKAFEIVRGYVTGISDDERAKLSSRITRIGQLDEVGLWSEAQRFVSYHAEPMKMPGLLEPDPLAATRLSPQRAVEEMDSYLDLDYRDLPQRVRDENTSDVPQLPWVEYGTNRWNRDYQIFGRYEAPLADGSLKVDYRMNSTHFPSKYGFFDTIEIIRDTEHGIGGHIILGQEVNPGMEAVIAGAMFRDPDRSLGSIYEELPDVVYPIVLAGNFNFRDPEIRPFLEKLAGDGGTKKEVGRVLVDVLKITQQGELQRVKSQ